MPLHIKLRKILNYMHTQTYHNLKTNHFIRKSI